MTTRSGFLAAVLTAAACAAIAPAAAVNAADSGVSSVPFEVRDLASDRGITLEEAEQRLDWQSRSEGLRNELSVLLPSTFAGYWFDVHGGDRPVLSLVGEADEVTVGLVRAELSRRGLDEVTLIRRDANESLRALEQKHQRLAAGARAANQGAPEAIAVAMHEPSNSTVISRPDQTTQRQDDFIAQAQGDGARLKNEQVRPSRQACSLQGGVRLDCDPSSRGGTRIATSEGETCTYGFFVRSRSNSAPYFTTAGHCFTGLGVSVRGFNSNGTTRSYGTLHRAYIGDYGDFALVNFSANAGWNPRPLVYVNSGPYTVRDETYYISSDAYANWGQRVCFTGGTSTNTDCGEITDNHIVINGEAYQRANYCYAFDGDSGGPVFSSHTAFGVHVARNDFAECDHFLSDINSVENTLNVNVVHGTS